MSKTTLLIDGDPLVYKFACGGHKTYDWGDGCVSEDIDLDKALERLDDFIENLEETFGSSSTILALTDAEANFRLDFYPQYKANRKALEKPVMWADIRAYMDTRYHTYLRPRLEGDDVLGILATSDKIVKTPRRIIVATDKDMKTIPGDHYNPDKDELFHVDEREADYWHLFQTLAGDAVDGYPGCPKIGPVKAARVLHRENLQAYAETFRMDLEDDWVEVAWCAVVDAYEDRFLTESDALTQARCARILRACDYDFSRKEPILWTPK